MLYTSPRIRRVRLKTTENSQMRAAMSVETFRQLMLSENMFMLGQKECSDPFARTANLGSFTRESTTSQVDGPKLFARLPVE